MTQFILEVSFLKWLKSLDVKSQLLEKMISNRKFRVMYGGKINRYKILQNSLPKEAVLSPMLFIYTADMTDIVSRKCIYTDNLALVTQATSFEEIESVERGLGKNTTTYYI